MKAKMLKWLFSCALVLSVVPLSLLVSTAAAHAEYVGDADGIPGTLPFFWRGILFAPNSERIFFELRIDTLKEYDQYELEPPDCEIEAQDVRSFHSAGTLQAVWDKKNFKVKDICFSKEADIVQFLSTDSCGVRHSFFGRYSRLNTDE